MPHGRTSPHTSGSSHSTEGVSPPGGGGGKPEQTSPGRGGEMMSYPTGPQEARGTEMAPPHTGGPFGFSPQKLVSPHLSPTAVTLPGGVTVPFGHMGTPGMLPSMAGPFRRQASMPDLLPSHLEAHMKHLQQQEQLHLRYIFGIF